MMDKTKEKLNASKIVNFLINGATNKLNENGRQNLYEWGVEMIEKYAEQSPETVQVDAIVSVPDLRNKLSPIKKLIAILEEDHVFVGFENGKGREVFNSELKRAKKVIDELCC